MNEFLLDARRRAFSLQIEQQRRDFATAYRQLARPLTYVETGIKGFNFFRRNQWLFIAAPAILNLTTSLFRLTTARKGRKPLAPVPRLDLPATPAAARAPVPRTRWGRVKQGLQIGGGYAFELFKLYRRIRPYL